ncbi:ABC transporter ATP-binding protein [Maribrevibacterium harenarium]|uniref:ABC transporter ATP-binding protein n=1 Tax=Maribrevibacterium harenarium TaxID=2589817 RepID=A0A501WN99_9GAMM|nr:ABC transporter ATP-binding protein [Maribrevibacterium harenarium]TPE50909.1 ABC transporter ATP-binding protein [Maribrevibacterium harenarium]
MTEQSPVVQNSLELNDVALGYQGMSVIEGVNFTLQEGKIGCLLGPSGCGKSTLLRAIAGFEPLMQGSIKLSGVQIADTTVQLAPEKRQIGMVFQDIALFPHLSIGDNIGFGLRHWSKAARRERIAHLLKVVGLEGYEGRYPQSLSGGQQQRIALARAIAPKPKLLLMDEPFSGLDAKLRETLVPEIRQILLQEQVSALLVSHDQAEAFAMADIVAVLASGEVQQIGTPYAIYHEPATRFVASFIGQGDFLPAQVCSSHCVHSALGEIKGIDEHGFAPDTKVDLLVRPEDIRYDEHSSFKGKVVSKWFRGAHFLYRVELADGKVVYCYTSSHQDLAIGQEMGIRVELDHLVLFPRV